MRCKSECVILVIFINSEIDVFKRFFEFIDYDIRLKISLGNEFLILLIFK